MSGPKSGHVSFSPEQLEAQQRQREAQEQRELESLERKSALSAQEQRRAEKLQRKAILRAEKEKARARQRVEEAERRRAHELVEFQTLIAKVADALQERTNISIQYAGISLPAALDIPDLPPGDADAVRRATQQLEMQLREYRRSLDAALNQWQRDQAAANAISDTRARVSAFKARAVRSAADVIAAIDDNSPLLASLQREARQKLLAERARTALSQVSNVVLSGQTVVALDQLLDPLSTADSSVAFELFRVLLNQDVEAARVKQEAVALEAKKLAEGQAQHNRELVLQVIQDAFDDLGWNVGTVTHTATPYAGRIVATGTASANHAVLVDIRDDGTLQVEAMRIARDAPPTGDADRRVAAEEDRKFDRDWCSAHGLVRVLNTVRSRGVDVRVRAEHPAGTIVLKQIAHDQLPEVCRTKTSAATKQQALQERFLPGSG